MGGIMKICKKCKHCGTNLEKTTFYTTCSIPCLRGQVKEVTNLVTGTVSTHYGYLCVDERDTGYAANDNHEKCGEEGKFYEEIEQETAK